jgi:mRNA-degrading endonuclease HigB of HigAB toxin-antitoxin module
MAGKVKVPVTRRALIQRVNRALEKNGEQLKATKGAQAQLDLGEFYVVDVSGNSVSRKDVDLERLARELGALKPYETLAD